MTDFNESQLLIDFLTQPETRPLGQDDSPKQAALAELRSALYSLIRRKLGNERFYEIKHYPVKLAEALREAMSDTRAKNCARRVVNDARPTHPYPYCDCNCKCKRRCGRTIGGTYRHWNVGWKCVTVCCKGNGRPKRPKTDDASRNRIRSRSNVGAWFKSQITKKCTRVAGRAFPEIKVTWRQPGDFGR